MLLCHAVAVNARFAPCVCVKCWLRLPAESPAHRAPRSPACSILERERAAPGSTHLQREALHQPGSCPMTMPLPPCSRERTQHCVHHLCVVCGLPTRQHRQPGALCSVRRSWHVQRGRCRVLQLRGIRLCRERCRGSEQPHSRLAHRHFGIARCGAAAHESLVCGVAAAPSQHSTPGHKPHAGVATLLYCLMAAVIVLMVPYNQIDINAPFSAAFQQAGMGWAARIVSAGAVTGWCSRRAPGLPLRELGQRPAQRVRATHAHSRCFLQASSPRA